MAYNTNSKIYRLLGIDIGPSPANRTPYPSSPPVDDTHLQDFEKIRKLHHEALASPPRSQHQKYGSQQTARNSDLSPPIELEKTHTSSRMCEVVEEALKKVSVPSPSSLSEAAQGKAWPLRFREYDKPLPPLPCPAVTPHPAPWKVVPDYLKHSYPGNGRSAPIQPQLPTVHPHLPNRLPAPLYPTRDYRFWILFATLCMAHLLVAFEMTVTATALPTIVLSLQSGELWVWILNGYLLTSTVSQTLYSQFSRIWGRRWPTLFAIAIFILGSGISGGANSTTTLIAGRVVQGIGGGGIMRMMQVVINDLFSARERGKYLGIVYGVFGVGLSIGPVLGGIMVQRTSWRWVFWMSVPIGLVLLLLQYQFLRVGHQNLVPLSKEARSIDYIGNILLIASVVAILLALSWADTKTPWSSSRILTPLCLGVLGIAAFAAFEASSWCKIPIFPPALFTNRTCCAALVLTFLQMTLTFWRTYFLPLYFQAVLGHSPTRAGVLLLPSFAASVPASFIAEFVLSKTGRYKRIHFFGFGISLVASGLYTLLGEGSSLFEIVVFQTLAGIGMGVTLMTLLPAAQADMLQELVAAVTAGFGFLGGFGAVWGVAIPAAVFQARFERLREGIVDVGVRERLTRGMAYQHVSSGFVGTLSNGAREEVVAAFEGSLRLVWQVALAVAVVCCVVMAFEKELRMERRVGVILG